MDDKINSRAQVSIWIMLGIFLVFAFGLFFFLKTSPEIKLAQNFEPKVFISQCTRNYVNEAIDKMLPQGGFISPKNSVLYKDINVTYLCETTGNYKSCISQHPLFLSEMEKEIENYISPKIEECFLELILDLKEKNYEVSLEAQKINVSLYPNKVSLNINKKITLKKGDEVRNFENFNFDVKSPVYNLGSLAIEIANSEAKYCYFEYIGYNILYPEVKVKLFTNSDSNRIYTLIDKKTNKEMNIAIRSCYIPPGI